MAEASGGADVWICLARAPYWAIRIHRPVASAPATASLQGRLGASQPFSSSVPSSSVSYFVPSRLGTIDQDPRLTQVLGVRRSHRGPWSLVMSGAGLPAVRLPTVIAGQGDDEEHLGESPVVVDLPPSNKFGFAWPTESSPSVPLPLAAERPAGVSFSSSEGETDISEEELSRPSKRSNRAGDSEDSEFVTPTNHLDSDQNPMDQAAQPPPLPRLSRAFSMPLPSQLGPLRNPRRVASSSPDSNDIPTVIELPPEHAHFHEFSLSLADSVQMAIQTLLQLSPPQVLDPAKEQFSACSLSIPTPSMSAMFTSMKNLNYMSANMSALTLDPPLQQASTAGERVSMPVMHNDFDIGEMLQSVGDASSGLAAQAGVDLVLFHGDLGMKHVGVKGDETGLSFALSHVRTVLHTTNERFSFSSSL